MCPSASGPCWGLRLASGPQRHGVASGLAHLSMGFTPRIRRSASLHWPLTGGPLKSRAFAYPAAHRPFATALPGALRAGARAQRREFGGRGDRRGFALPSACVASLLGLGGTQNRIPPYGGSCGLHRGTPPVPPGASSRGLAPRPPALGPGRPLGQCVPLWKGSGTGRGARARCALGTPAGAPPPPPVLGPDGHWGPREEAPRNGGIIPSK